MSLPHLNSLPKMISSSFIALNIIYILTPLNLYLKAQALPWTAEHISNCQSEIFILFLGKYHKLNTCKNKHVMSLHLNPRCSLFQKAMAILSWFLGPKPRRDPWHFFPMAHTNSSTNLNGSTYIMSLSSLPTSPLTLTTAMRSQLVPCFAYCSPSICSPHSSWIGTSALKQH